VADRPFNTDCEDAIGELLGPPGARSLVGVLDRRTWNTREELRIAIVTRIERTYHRRRRQSALGRLTPVEYELIMKPVAIQAA
jgi:putative transposase